MLIYLRTLLFFLLIPCSLYAQLSGVVLDAESNEPIGYAGLMLNQTPVGQTDQQGRFMLDSARNMDCLAVIHPGYGPYSDTLGLPSAGLVIRLSPNQRQLAEVIVSTPSRSQKLRMLAGSFALLTRSDLDGAGNITVAAYMNQAPGVFMQQGALNTNRLTIRGIGSRTPYTTNRIKAYFDEVPLTSGDGATTLEDIDMEGIGRIEILKGPSSAIYGSGLGGTVKFYPMKQEDKNTIRIHSSAGSFGTFKNSLTSSLKLKDDNIAISYSNVYSDGYRQNSRYQRNSAFLFATHEAKKSSLKLTMNLVDVNSQIASSLDEGTFTSNPQLAAKNWLAVKGYEDYTKALGGLTYTTFFNKQFYHQVTFFGGLMDHKQSRPFNILDDNSLNCGLRDKATFSWEKITLVGGVEWFREDYRWKIFETDMGKQGNLTNDNKEKRTYLNTFALWKFTLQNLLVLEAGLNVTTLAYRVTDTFPDTIDNSGSYRYKPVVSPRFGVNYQLSDNVNFYSSCSHGFSMPSLQETLMPEGQPNPGLKPEEGYNIEVGTHVNLWEKRVYVSIAQYWLFLRNLLVTKRVSEEIFTGENAGKTNHHGTELLVKFNVLPDSPRGNALDLSVSYTYSINRFKSFTNDANDYSGKMLPGIPSDVLHVNTLLKLRGNLSLYAGYQAVGRQYLTDDNSGAYRGYQLLGLKAEYGQRFLKKHHWSIYAGTQNLFNETYASMILVNAPQLGITPPRYYYPGNPRNFYAGLKVTL